FLVKKECFATRFTLKDDDENTSIRPRVRQNVTVRSEIYPKKILSNYDRYEQLLCAGARIPTREYGHL
ncbi:MAG: hypothetical protein E7I10_05365, partial [Enterobacter asburiae]|nr:hypothetical protein [Enterobacter asburiae]